MKDILRQWEWKYRRFNKHKTVCGDSGQHEQSTWVIGEKKYMFTSPKYNSYRNAAQLLFLTELPALHTRPLQPLLPLAVTSKDRDHPLSWPHHREAQTPAQRQGVPKPWAYTAWSCLHQPRPRLWNFSIGPSNSWSSLPWTRDPHQGWIGLEQDTQTVAMDHPKKSPTPSGKDFTLLCTQMIPWLLSRYTSMPDAKIRKYFLSYSTQTRKCRGI